MKHFVSWVVLPECLKKLAKDIEESPIISIEIEPNVELVIKNAKFAVKEH